MVINQYCDSTQGLHEGWSPGTVLESHTGGSVALPRSVWATEEQNTLLQKSLETVEHARTKS